MNLKLKLKGQLYALFIPGFIGICIILCIIFSVMIKRNMTQMLQSDMKSNAKFYEYMINKECQGSYEIRDGKLYKGDKSLDDTSILYSMKVYSGCDYSWYCNDTRFYTTITAEKNLVGKKADKKISDQVINKKGQFMGSHKIGQIQYYTYYKPIFSKDGDVLGMLFIGKDITKEMKQFRECLIEVIGISVVVIGIIMVFMAIITGRISKRFKGVSKYMNILGENDFSKEIPKNVLEYQDESGEIFRSVKKMQNDIKTTLTSIHGLSQSVSQEANALSGTSEEISKATENVTENIQNIAQGAMDQANNLTSINDATTVFGQSVTNVENSVNVIQTHSDQIRIIAEKSNGNMKNVKDVLMLFTTSFEQYSSKMKSFAKEMENVVNIVDTIENISKQTNLLALNAAIEAARAGDAGKGFSVVAEEIRALAEESQKATKGIADIITAVSGQTQELIERTNTMDDQLENETVSLEDMMKSFDEIFNALDEILPRIKAVAEETSTLGQQKVKILQQIEGASAIADKISASCQEVSASTEEMNTTTEEVAQTAQNLAQMTEGLTQNVNIFKI